jgi:hypothetical protein
MREGKLASISIGDVSQIRNALSQIWSIFFQSMPNANKLAEFDEASTEREKKLAEFQRT